MAWDAKARAPLSWACACLSLVSLLFLAGAESRSATLAADAAPLRTANPANDAPILDAICPIVYPVDESASERGYQYIFYGNAFFINRDGYLLTAAHVLSAFRNGGGQPYILVSRRAAPPSLQKADLIAVDWEHDVAVLRAKPNPFDAKHARFKVAYLSLTTQDLFSGSEVLAVALRPPKVDDAHTFQAPLKDRLASHVVDYQFTQEEKGAGETELLVFDHEVLKGQSGAPVISAGTHQVVGIVDGRWLRPVAVPAALAGTREGNSTGLGAAVRIHYAIALLQQHGISWQAVSEASSEAPIPQVQDNEEQLRIPFPLSVVPAPYPPQSLFGGEVILDALVGANGNVTDINVVHGDPPFLDKAQRAVQTWSFRPARIDDRETDERVAVAFEFAEPYLPSPKQRTHTYPEPPDSDDRAPLPVYTVEPEYPVNAVAEGSVIVLGMVDAQGQLTATLVIRDAEPLTAATVSAMHQWRFIPGKKAGQTIASAVIVAAAFRRPILARAPGAAK